MNKNIVMKIVGLIIMLLILLCINNKALGASAKINAPSTAYVGDKITVTVTGNAASWSNLTLKVSGQISGSGGTMANVTSSGENENVTMGTYTFTATAEGSATFTLSGLVVNSDYSKNNASDSKTIKIIKKEEPKKETTTTPETNKPANNNMSNNKPTNNKKSTTTKQEQKKQETAKQEEPKQEEINPKIDENSNSIEKNEIVGNNEIEGNSENKEENNKDSQELKDENKRAPAIISMPVWKFVVLQIAIIAVEVLTIVFIIKRKIKHNK